MAKDDISKQAKDFSDNLEGMSTSFKYIQANIDKMGSKLETSYGAMHQLSSATKEVGNALKENADVLKRVEEGELSVSEVKKLQKESQERLNKLQEKRQNLAKKISAMGTAADQKRLKSIDQQTKKLQAKAKTEQKLLDDAVKKAQTGQSRMASGFDKMGGILGKMGLSESAKTIGKMAANTRKTTIAGGSLAKMFDGKVAGALGKIGKMNPFMIILGAIVSVVKMILKVNQEVATLGRGLGVSAERAAQVRQHFVNVSAELGKLGVDYDNILEAQGNLNDALGTSAEMISGKIVGGMALLTQRMKLSAESAVGFAKAALAAGRPVEDLAKDALGGALAAEREFGARVDMNKVLERTGKIGGQVRAIFGNNLELLGGAVAKAQLLGMELGEVANQSKQMLNFHQSIENELKAELFLGKKLNLEQARLASLVGDYDTYMDEIRKNAGDFYEFSQLNVLQQNALANALGMSTDQLADMLLQEEDLLALKQKARAEGKEELYQNLQQMSAQEAFNAALEKMKKLFVNIAANIENMKIPGFLSMLITGDRSLAGKRLADLVGPGMYEDSIKKLQTINTDDSIYGDSGMAGVNRAPQIIGINPPPPIQQQNTNFNMANSNSGGWTSEEKNALIQNSRKNTTLTQSKFGSKSYFDNTKYDYGKI